MPFAIAMAALYVVIGWATWRFAPRIGPNPVFGVRTSLTLANRRAWDAANRLGGIILAAMGLVMFAVIGLAALAGVDDSGMNWVVFGYVVASLVVLGVWAIRYPRRFVEETPPGSRRR